MYPRRRIPPLIWTAGIIMALVLLVFIAGRLDFPGWVLRVLAGAVPSGSPAAYTPGEVAEIRGELSRLEGESALLKEMVIRFQGEEGLEGIEASLGYPLLTAHVIYRDHAGLFDTAIIDRGSVDGVEAEMPVVDSRGLVGRVVATRAAVSRIALISSPDCAFGVIDQRSRDIGVVRGTEGVRWSLGDADTTAPDLLRLEYLSPSADISVQDELVTSGYSGITPRGIRVGEVVEIITREEEGRFDIRVRPFADLDHLETVGVVLYWEEVRKDIDELVEEGGGEVGPPGE